MRLPFQLPDFDAGSVLVVSLIRPIGEAREIFERDIQNVIPALKLDPAPSLKLVYSLSAGRSQRPLHYGGVTDKNMISLSLGTRARLFAIASLARKKGWKHLAVADEISFQQLDAESPGFSFVYIQLSEPTKSESYASKSRTESVEIVAKRMGFNSVVRILAQNETFDMLPLKEQSDPWWCMGPFYDQYWSVLHNPENSLFQPDFSVDRLRSEFISTVLKAMSLKPSLPMELKLMILNSVKQEVSIDAMTDAPRILKNDTHTMEIHALFPGSDLTPVKNRLDESIKMKDPQMSVNLYAWKGHLPATRGDVWRLWDRIINCHQLPVYFAACFLDTASAEGCDSVILALWNHAGTATAYRVSLDYAVELWKTIHQNRNEALKAFLHEDENTFRKDKITDIEMLHCPNNTFPDKKPPWRKTGGSDTAVFFLTKIPDAQAIENLENEMCRDIGSMEWTRDEYPDGPYIFTPWESDKDGVCEDMLRIATEAYYDTGGRLGQRYLIFVDQHSFDDKKVIFSR